MSETQKNATVPSLVVGRAATITAPALNSHGSLS